MNCDWCIYFNIDVIFTIIFKYYIIKHSHSKPFISYNSVLCTNHKYFRTVFLNLNPRTKSH